MSTLSSQKRRDTLSNSRLANHPHRAIIEEEIDGADTNHDGKIDKTEVGEIIVKLMDKRDSEARATKKNRILVWIVWILTGFLIISVASNAGMVYAVVASFKDTKVNDDDNAPATLQTVNGDPVSTHPSHTVFDDIVLTPEGSVVSCSSVLKGIKQLSNGENIADLSLSDSDSAGTTVEVYGRGYELTSNTMQLNDVAVEGNLYEVNCPIGEEACKNAPRTGCPIAMLTRDNSSSRDHSSSLRQLRHVPGHIPGMTEEEIAELIALWCDSDDPDDCCHPASSVVELPDGKHASLQDAPVGTLIRTPVGYEPIVGFLHAEIDTQGSYFRFHTSNGSIAISPLHWLWVNGVEQDPAFVLVGDNLSTVNGAALVTRISHVSEPGAFHPVVESGSYYVDGLLASDYNAHVPMLAWNIVREYFVLRYHMGAPLIPDGVGAIPYQPVWGRMAKAAIGTPLAVQCIVYPVVILGMVLTELTNLLIKFAATHPDKLVTTAALAVAARHTGVKLK